MFLQFAVLVFAFQRKFTNADSGLPNNKYPGLTLAEARCPDSAKDENYWYIVPGFNNTFGCFGRTNLPANLHTFDEVEDTCREKHKDAIPARFRIDYNYGDYGSLKENAIIGAAYTTYGVQMSSNGTAVHLASGYVETVNLTTFSADPSGKYILCMTPPYPRFMHTYYNKPHTIQRNLSEYICEGNGWNLHASCYGTPFCYKKRQIPKFPLMFRNMLAEFNICGMQEPNSFVASVHCQEEYDYIKSNYARGNTIQLGLYVPNRAPWNKADSWQNTDGTPVDFAPWLLHEPNDGYDERNVFFGKGFDWIDFNGGHGNFGSYTKHVLCKKAAVKTDLSQDVQNYDVFKVNGKRCRFERATHWNRQCPTNSSLWQIVPSDEGVHCYALVNTPVPLSNNNFKDEICHSLHPQAKLASIHYDRQFGFLYPLAYNTPAVIVGLVKNNESFIWSDDGTPVDNAFWAPSEPSLDSSDALVQISNIQKLSPSLTPTYRPLFKTIPFKDVKAGMKVACKIKAEPLIPCLPVPDTDKMESLNNAICPAGWTKQRFCGKVFCYQQVSVEHKNKTFGNTVEKDYCNAHYPGSYLASIHCVEEHFFVQNYSSKTLIGLHVPTKFHNDAFDVKNFKWTDGTPLDFVAWNRFSNHETIDDQYAPLFPTKVNENIKFAHVYNKFNDITSGWSNLFGGFESVLCKMKATAKQDT